MKLYYTTRYRESPIWRYCCFSGLSWRGPKGFPRLKNRASCLRVVQFSQNHAYLSTFRVQQYSAQTVLILCTLSEIQNRAPILEWWWFPKMRASKNASLLDAFLGPFWPTAGTQNLKISLKCCQKSQDRLVSKNDSKWGPKSNPKKGSQTNYDRP